MAHVFISIGSNIDQKKYIRIGIASLSHLYKPLSCSTVYESEAIGFEGDNFYNLVVSFDTNESIAEVSANLTKIEDENGRHRSGPRFSSRTLDLDLLLYDSHIVNSESLTLPRLEIYENAFVLLPLSEVSGAFIDPIKDKTYSQLWQIFDKESQKLWAIDFDLN